jgi:sugar/nucleoside kinase (ribokinase family)
MEAEFAYDVFLSHNNADKPRVRKLAERLRAVGLRIWFDEWLIQPGDDICLVIERGLKASRKVVLCLSPAALESGWVGLEWRAALFRDLATAGHRLIPLLLVNCTIPDILRARKYIDYRQESESAFEQLRSICAETTVDPTRPSTPVAKVDCVLCVGSAVSENVRQALGPIRLNEKNFTRRRELFGGGGYNYTCRLLAMGIPVIPILAIGDDSLARRIQESLKGYIERLPDSCRDRISSFVMDDRFLCRELNTVESAIIVSGPAGRTIFTEEPQNATAFAQFVERRLQTLEEEFSDLHVRAVMIGHLYADNQKFIEADGGRFGADGSRLMTKRLVERFQGRFVFAKFGESQYERGDIAWEDCLEKLDIFQLSMKEIRKFFKAGTWKASGSPSLEEIIRCLRGHTKCAVVTMDKFGAVAVERNKANRLLIAWPHVIPNLVDPTGAGDAFGAGLVAWRFRNEGRWDLRSALEQARDWAAYACTTLGAANECPNEADLERFKNKIADWRRPTGLPDYEVDVTNDEGQYRKLLWLFDKAYQ